MNKKDKVWFNGIYPYFRMLKKINKLLVLQVNLTPHLEKQEDNFFELTSELLRILPFKIDMEKMTIQLLKKDGILLLKDYFDDLENDYESIVNDNFKTLFQIIKIRNKYIHEPHNIKCVDFSYSRGHTRAGFKYKNEYFELGTEEIIKIVEGLNNTFEKIQIKCKNKVAELDEKDKDHPYILNLIDNYFMDYNFILRNEEEKWCNYLKNVK